MELDSIYEEVLNYHINDYIIFEGVLRRDILEVNGILNEEGNKNFLKSLWEKIVGALNNLVEKIKDIIERFQKAFAAFKQSKIDQIVRQYYKYFNKEKGELKDFSIKNYKLKKFEYVLDIMYTLEDEYDENVKEFDNIQTYFGQSDDKIKAAIEKLDNIKVEDMKNKFKKTIYAENEIVNPFKENPKLKNKLDSIISLFFDKNSNLNDYLIRKREHKEDFKSARNFANKRLKEIEKDKNMSEEERKSETNKCILYLQFISKYQKYALNFLSLYFKEQKNIVKECTRLYVAAGKFLKAKMNIEKNDNNAPKVRDKRILIDDDEFDEPFDESFITDDIDYINAIVEAEMYELEL